MFWGVRPLAPELARVVRQKLAANDANFATERHGLRPDAKVTGLR